ncbi:MAG: TRAP transporter large permease subunit [Alcaligenaceae bacterium]|nr:TRAP transporter large permease subunit [Alcaligenaceae bacterium]
MIFIWGTFILLGTILAAIPIGFALGLAGIGSLALLVPVQTILALMSKVVHATSASYVILTIPMFVLMAEFLGCGGIAQDLMIACNRLLRRVRGGMAIACVFSGAILAAASGSSTASAASITRAAFPAMRKAGYDRGFAAGTIAIAGTLAIMIPPSTAFVLYGLMTETSIGKLFLAGIFPGLVTAAGYVFTIMLVLKLRPDLGAKPELEAKLATEQKGSSVWPMALLIIVVLGGLYSGMATPTEIAAIGALGALLVALATRRMTRPAFVDAVGNTLRITAMIVTIIFGAHIFGYFISFSQITNVALSWIAASELSPTVVMLMVVFVYLLLGMVMDQAAIIILTAPISLSLMTGLGYNPIWWGVIIIKTAEIGMVSPPMGLNVFVTSSAARVDLRACFRGVMPFVATEFIVLALLLAFPEITLFFVS